MCCVPLFLQHSCTASEACNAMCDAIHTSLGVSLRGFLCMSYNLYAPHGVRCMQHVALRREELDATDPCHCLRTPIDVVFESPEAFDESCVDTTKGTGFDPEFDPVCSCPYAPRLHSQPLGRFSACSCVRPVDVRSCSARVIP